MSSSRENWSCLALLLVLVASSLGTAALVYYVISEIIEAIP